MKADGFSLDDKRNPIADNDIENTGDRISILLHCHSSDYFLYKGSPIGFQYELLHLMCDSLGLKPRFILSTDAAEVKEGMLTGTYDIISPLVLGDDIHILLEQQVVCEEAG